MRVRWIWPVAAVRGRASTIATRRGCLNAGEPAGAERAERLDGHAARAGARDDHRGHDLAPLHVGHADDRDLERRRDASPSTASTSGGATVSPPVRITSRARPTIDDVAVVVEHAEIAGVVPAVDERLGGRVGIVEVAVHQERAAHADLAALVEPHLDAGLRDADAAGLARTRSTSASDSAGPASVDP